MKTIGILSILAALLVLATACQPTVPSYEAIDDGENEGEEIESLSEETAEEVAVNAGVEDLDILDTEDELGELY